MKHSLTIVCLILLLLLVAGTPGCEKVTVTDSGELTDWRFDYSDFTELEIDHGFVIDIVYGETFSINITVDRAVFEYLVVDQHGKKLHIGLENGPEYVDTTQGAVVTMPALQYLKLSSGSIATLTGFATGRSISFELTGNSTLEIPSYTAADVVFTISGGSTVDALIDMNNGEFKLSDASTLSLEGSAGDMIIEGTGNSRFLMDGFPVQTADIKLSSSNASIQVNELLIFDVSDGSQLDYGGDPMLRDIKVSGDSTVNRVSPD